MVLDLAIDNRVLLTTELDCALQEIDMLLNTENTELLGYTNYGVNMEQFLWTLTPTTNELRKYINEKLANFTTYVTRFNYEVHCFRYDGEYRSIYVVNITLKDEETGLTGQRTYQYQ
jgi:hypothetical protein